MCEICHQYVCPPSCPNSNESARERIGRCALCGEDVLDGENAIWIDDVLYHMECLEDMTVTELLDEFDIEYEIVSGGWS